jgi:hypothetical protein
MSPCPEGFYLVVEIIPCHAQIMKLALTGTLYRISLCFDDAIDRADTDALGGIGVTDTFDTSGLVDHIENPITFADRFSRAFGYACATGDAVFLDFHGHGYFSVKKFLFRL